MGREVKWQSCLTPWDEPGKPRRRGRAVPPSAVAGPASSSLFCAFLLPRGWSRGFRSRWRALVRPVVPGRASSVDSALDPDVSSLFLLRPPRATGGADGTAHLPDERTDALL